MKFRNFNFSKLRQFKNFSLVFISEYPGVKSRTQKIALMPALGILFSYTLFAAFIGFLFFSFTPVKNIIFPETNSLSSSDKILIKELNDRMLNLSKELYKIKTANETLRNSIQGPLIPQNTKGGNLYSVALDFMKKFIFNQRNDITFMNPAEGYISRGFLPDNGHMGVDYVLKTGTPIHSTASGYVLFSDYSTKDGYMVIILHPDNYISIYKHCSALIKKEREKVLQGELVALSGNSGEITSGPHLHFEIWKQGKPIDPLTVLINNKEVK